MVKDKDEKLNVYNFFGFPDRQKRDEVLEIFNIDELRLIPVEDFELCFWDTYFEKYNIWRIHINNFSSRLILHFLLMYYQYSQEPLDNIEIEKIVSPKRAHKLFFDTFAEDVSLYLISYFDKHIEMFSDLYNLKEIYIKNRNKKNSKNSKNKNEKNYSPSRYIIIKEMKKVKEIEKLAKGYEKITESVPFLDILNIRNNFVHNISSSYYGMKVSKIDKGVYAIGNSTGISTKSTYNSICELLKSYEEMCIQVNLFMESKIESSK